MEKSHSYNCRYEEYSIQKRTQRAIDLKHYINQQKEIKKNTRKYRYFKII